MSVPEVVQVVCQGPDAGASGTGLLKKGVGVWYYPPLESVLVDLGVSWFYNWRPTASEESIVPPPGVEFVPMVASADDVNATILEGLKQEPSPNLLGFNEPDILSQNPTSVSRAIALWPQLEATGKRLGSPATAFKPLQSPWFDDFMNQAARQGLRVDFLNVHYFAENTNRWNAAFVKAASEMMNSLDYVERYAYFPLWPYVVGCQSQLYDIDGNITVVGEAYKSVK